MMSPAPMSGRFGTKIGLPERLLTARRLVSWLRRDRLLGERFTVLAVCSETDKSYLHKLGVKAPVHVIPNGFLAARCAASPEFG